MSVIMRSPWTRQPQRLVSINQALWPGRTQTLLPSLRRAGVNGEIANFTSANANGDIFGNLSIQGHALGFRPNSATDPGEVFTWDAGDFDVGADASMIALITQRDAGYDSYIGYGGSNWGLALIVTSGSAVASYVDNPPSADYDATISGLTNVVGRYEAVGLVKRGNTISVFHRGVKASTSGGNGGIRRSAGSGIGSAYNIRGSGYAYGSTALCSITSVPVSDAQMFALLRNPWAIFAPRRFIVPVAAAASAVPTLSALSAINVTASSAQPRITYTF